MGNVTSGELPSTPIPADDWRRGARPEFTSKAGSWGLCPVGCLSLHEADAAIAVCGVGGDLSAAGVFSPTCELIHKFYGHGDTVKKSAAGALKNGEGIDGSIVFTVALSGDMLVTGGADSTLRLWEWQTGNAVGRIDGAHGDLEIMCIALDGDTLVSAAGQEVKRWSLRSRECAGSMRHAGYVRAVAIGASAVLSAGEDRVCHAWARDAADTSAPLLTLEHPGGVWALSVDGDVAATACRCESSLVAWDTQVRSPSAVHSHRAPPPAPPPPPPRPALIGCVAYAVEAQVRLWKLSTGELLVALSDPIGNHADKVTCLALRGGLLASGARDGRLKVWNVADAQSAECLTSMPSDAIARGERGDAVAVQGVCITRMGAIVSVAAGRPCRDEHATCDAAGEHELVVWAPMPQV